MYVVWLLILGILIGSNPVSLSPVTFLPPKCAGLCNKILSLDAEQPSVQAESGLL